MKQDSDQFQMTFTRAEIEAFRMRIWELNGQHKIDILKEDDPIIAAGLKMIRTMENTI